MKSKIFLLIQLLFLVGLTNRSFAGQPFEGSIRYSMQLKGSGSAEMAAIFPKEMKLKMKGDKLRTELMGGLMESMMGVIISNPSKNVNCILNNTIKVAYSLEIDSANADEPLKATPTGNKEKIAGYKCEEYIVEMASGEKNHIWITTQLQFPRVKGAKQSGLTQFFNAIPGGNGMPMRVSQRIGDSEMVIEVLEVKKEKLDDQLFEIPEGYPVTPFNPSIFGGDEGDE